MSDMTRRTFVAAAAAATGAAALAQSQSSSAAKPLRILILGGTGFIGPYQVRYAVDRGHKVTVFNRGKTNPNSVPAGVERLQGDRSNGQLDSLKGKEWDVVIDNPSTLPRWVRDAATLLKDSASQYVFISTISVYKDESKPGMDESAPVIELPDPTVEQITGEAYGGLKALAEKEAEKAFPGRTTVIRPGLIVGAGDNSDRFTYWPVRIARGGEVLAPGNPTDPVQFIDARDLAEWTIRVVEQKTFGTYNAVGPAHRLSVAEMLYGIKAVTTAGAQFTWVPASFLEEQKVAPWSDMPVWVPATGEYAGFGSISIKRALDAGLTFRPLADTAKATLEYHESRDAERKAKFRAGIKPEREAEVLAAWKAQKK
ncbi:MAG TPA: NAD-dependent epimerase/dehydratase family protein [Thermoanaerobaculia bacterium]|jgi:2'-hydroxyisoflavone reductase|nr:NAD-dependent epimerase/dehydratase family protein [Thermoanaerobaculia bacterium]